MDNPLLFLELAAFTIAWWLGLYILGRDRRNPLLVYTGLGLIAYALTLAFDMLRKLASEPEVVQALGRWGWPFLFLPALFWAGTLIFLLPADSRARGRLEPIVKKGLLPLALLFYFVAVAAQVFETDASGNIVKSPVFSIFSALVVMLLFGCFFLLIGAARGRRLQFPLSLIVIATLFFGLGSGLLLIPLDLVPAWFLVLGIGLDLVLLGIGIALTDAFDKGEALLPDFLRSFAYSLLLVLLFGSQVALAMALGSGVTLIMLLLLLAVIMSAIVTQTFADPIQAGLDWMLFARIPRIRQDRADGRIIASSAPRTRDVVDPVQFNDEQFSRLTRRALSHMGNLPRLSASPLTRMELIESRLADRSVADNTLERAAELKKVLSESIDRLKPRDGNEFGTNDAWRYYNALYYPYVIGLKPYSLRVEYQELDPPAKSTLIWFQSQVPERTLYNWQNAAAKLVAQDVREQAGRAAQDH
jgi:hypothetical protein